MLRNQNLGDKTYEERINEGIMEIPLYSSEWTNYNASDPGITILENLSLFETLQQNHINDMPVAVKAKLLKIMGFAPIKGRNSRVLLSAENTKETVCIPKGHSFNLENISFETRKDITINECRLTSIYGKIDDSFRDFSYLLDRDIKLKAEIFSENPKVGNELYFFCNKLPEAKEEAIFYFEMEDSKGRNTFDEKEFTLFASVKWEVFSEEGFKEINAIDRTGGFISSGEVNFRFPDYTPVKYDERGYLIKATLMKAEYDIAPTIRRVFAFLFEVWQQHTESISITGKKGSQIEIPAHLAKNHYISIFAREEGNNFYRHYEINPGEKLKGRYFDLKEDGDSLIYKFDQKKFGYSPVRGNAAVRVIAYSPKIMQNYNIGMVEGYDDQEIELPIKNVIADSFFIIARLIDEEGEKYYQFVRPGHKEEGALYYNLYERSGKIVIKDAGDFIGARLYMGGCSSYLGEAGNIRAGNYLTTKGIDESVRFYNPCAGSGGRFMESIEDVRRRFINDIDTPSAAITATDYEKIVLDTPGLCIRKAKAYIDKSRNEVKIAVLPGNIGAYGYPCLTADYEKVIRSRLESRRLLTTKITIMKPQYEPVNVKAIVYVDQYFEKNTSRIQKRIESAIDYINASNVNFGDPLFFERVFEAIEEDPGVEYISKLKISPSRSKYATVKEESIYPLENVLLVPGEINIELIPYNNK